MFVFYSMSESSLTWTFIFFHPALAGLSGQHKKFLVLFAQDLIVNCIICIPKRIFVF